MRHGDDLLRELTTDGGWRCDAEGYDAAHDGVGRQFGARIEGPESPAIETSRRPRGGMRQRDDGEQQDDGSAEHTQSTWLLPSVQHAVEAAAERVRRSHRRRG
jgi:hypothetical protein